ncbi:hypothetical protein [Lacrimispora indolis]|uniref:hypothetical protein n=1 Tax=Lacrimispora indolis TaxID=69825 RepID=UPI0004626DFD|nr:hypothetical protein [[Clostridium] methoxybenzovorans]
MDIPLVLEDPTKEVIGTDADGGETGLKEDGEIAYNAGPYGDLGKSTFDALAGAWVKGNITTEASLREIMDATYGDFSNKEALTKEILAMPRNTQPTQVAQETQSAPQETKSETKSQSQSGTATPPTKADTTQPATQEQETYAVTPEQQAEYDKFWQEARENPAKVGDGGVGTPINGDDAAAKWGWN